MVSVSGTKRAIFGRRKPDTLRPPPLPGNGGAAARWRARPSSDWPSLRKNKPQARKPAARAGPRAADGLHAPSTGSLETLDAGQLSTKVAGVTVSVRFSVLKARGPVSSPAAVAHSRKSFLG